MSAVENGGPAFPVPGLQHDETFNGMGLRDYFAAKAMQGLLVGVEDPYQDNVARMSYIMADAMLAARVVQKVGAK